MSITELDTENADRDLTSQVTVLTDTPDASNNLICQALILFGDGVKNLDGSGGDFELEISVGGNTVQPAPQVVTFGTDVRAAVWTTAFPVPANSEVVIKAESPNLADTDVDVTAYLYDVSAPTGAETLTAFGTGSGLSALALATDLATLDGKVVTVDTVVDTLTTNLATLDGKVVTVDTVVDTLATDLATLDGKVVTVDTVVDTLTTNLATLDGKVVTVDTVVDTLTTNLATLDGKVVTVDTVADAVKVVTDKLADTLEDDGGTYRFTENALEEAPGGADVAAIQAVTDKLDTALEADGELYRFTENALEEAPAGADLAAIKAKTDLITIGRIQAVSPVLESGEIDLVAGDDYAAAVSTALTITIEAYGGPSLSGATAELRIAALGDYEAGGCATTLTLTDAGPEMSGADAVFTFEATGEQTAALGTVPPAAPLNYVHQLVVISGTGETATIALGAVNVKGAIA